MWPVQPHPTPTGLQVYGSPRSYAGGHIGSDYGVSTGTPVFAVSNGVIADSGWTDLVGNYVRVDHDNGVTTRSIHLSSRSVNTGDRVTAGQQIGLSGNTGTASQGPHLHIEVYLNRTNRTDPHAFFLQYVGTGNDEGDDLTPEQDARLKNIENILAVDDYDGRKGIRGIVAGNRASIQNIQEKQNGHTTVLSLLKDVLTTKDYDGRTGIEGIVSGNRKSIQNIQEMLTVRDGGGIRGVVDAIKAKLGA